jgi:hypothetical protein
MIEQTALMPIIFKIIGEIPRNISICRKSVRLGALHIRFSRLKKEDARQA